MSTIDAVAVASAEWLGPVPARWYCVSREGQATLCVGEEDARANAEHCDLAWPAGGPHRAVLLGDVGDALNLWPRDCRTCAHFRDSMTHSAHCVSAIRCTDSISYRSTHPVQLWERSPS